MERQTEELTVTFKYPTDFGNYNLRAEFSKVPDVLEQIVCALHISEPSAASRLFEIMPELKLLAGGVQATPEGVASRSSDSICKDGNGRDEVDLEKEWRKLLRSPGELSSGAEAFPTA